MPGPKATRLGATAFGPGILLSRSMRIAIDGIPLATPKTGIGHYTFELAQGLARLAPADEFELVAPVPVELGDGRAESLPPNLRAVQVPVNALSRRWWTIGLPLHV